MTKKLYVGNLNYATTEDQLHTLFSEIGPVASVALITDRDSGQSKGFGFVEMETEAAAQEAIQKLNNREVSGRNITVSEARPPRERSFGEIVVAAAAAVVDAETTNRPAFIGDQW
ncbi:MAG: RNA-binding protein [Chloroflexi bacterium]|nr:RNA-binding protein [Chloroflexota bacterium]